MVGKIEGRLFRLTLLTSRGERVGPQNSYLDWLAVSLFRQWLAESTSPPPAPPAPRSSQSRNGNGGHHSRNNTIPGQATHHTNSTVQQSSPLPPPSDISSNMNAVNPNLGRVFRIIGSSPASYLLHEECKRFLKLSPDIYSRESLKKFEKRLEDIKGMAREIVRPLMRCSLLGSGEGVSYLVCTKVSERDFPWAE